MRLYSHFDGSLYDSFGHRMRSAKAFMNTRAHAVMQVSVLTSNTILYHDFSKAHLEVCGFPLRNTLIPPPFSILFSLSLSLYLSLSVSVSSERTNNVGLGWD